MTRLTALWHVTEVLTKLITYNIKVKLKETKKAKKAKLETTNVIIRPSSKIKKLPKFCPNLVNFKTFPKIFGKICKLIIIDYYSHFFE